MEVLDSIVVARRSVRYPTGVRPLSACAAFLALAAAAACGGGGGAGAAGAGAGAASGGSTGPRQPSDPATAHTSFAEEDRVVPGYGKADLSRALIDERAAEATAERAISELAAKDPSTPADDDRLRIVAADLAVRRRFIASLEACEATGDRCPPRLDDPPWTYDVGAEPPPPPPLDAELRFDLTSWRKVAAELHGRACACRTVACLDSLGVAIDRLDGRPMPQVQDDDAATLSITRARECLARLRGRGAPARAPSPSIAAPAE